MMQIFVPENVYITSETDKTGKIVNINNEFINITGYTKEELINKPHSIIRHPDMPKEAFENMWNTIQAGRVWTGFVKNKTKDGNYYWVYATVSPISRADGFKGYTSIRQYMTQKEIDREEEKLAKYKQAKLNKD